MIDEKILIKRLTALQEKCWNRAKEENDRNFARKSLDISQIIGIINNQPKIDNWIPCMEKMPEPEKEIEISVKRVIEAGTYYFTVRGFYEDGNVWESESDYTWNFPDDVLEWNNGRDDFKVPESWWEQSTYAEEENIHCIDDYVLAWRPVPDPYIEPEHAAGKEQEG